MDQTVCVLDVQHSEVLVSVETWQKTSCSGNVNFTLLPTRPASAVATSLAGSTNSQGSWFLGSGQNPVISTRISVSSSTAILSNGKIQKMWPLSLGRISSQMSTTDARSRRISSPIWSNGRCQILIIIIVCLSLNCYSYPSSRPPPQKKPRARVEYLQRTSSQGPPHK